LSNHRLNERDHRPTHPVSKASGLSSVEEAETGRLKAAAEALVTPNTRKLKTGKGAYALPTNY